MNPKIRDITGEQFGKLTVLSFAGTNKKRVTLWRVRCDCGNEKVTTRSALMDGDTTSCGCAKRKHGHTVGGNTKEYEAWTNMLHRCSHPDYPDYHGRGITVCDAWRRALPSSSPTSGRRPRRRTPSTVATTMEITNRATSVGRPGASSSAIPAPLASTSFADRPTPWSSWQRSPACLGTLFAEACASAGRSRTQ